MEIIGEIHKQRGVGKITEAIGGHRPGAAIIQGRITSVVRYARTVVIINDAIAHGTAIDTTCSRTVIGAVIASDNAIVQHAAERSPGTGDGIV